MALSDVELAELIANEGVAVFAKVEALTDYVTEHSALPPKCQHLWADLAKSPLEPGGDAKLLLQVFVKLPSSVLKKVVNTVPSQHVDDLLVGLVDVCQRAPAQQTVLSSFISFVKEDQLCTFARRHATLLESRYPQNEPILGRRLTDVLRSLPDDLSRFESRLNTLRTASRLLPEGHAQLAAWRRVQVALQSLKQMSAKTGMFGGASRRDVQAAMDELVAAIQPAMPGKWYPDDPSSPDKVTVLRELLHHFAPTVVADRLFQKATQSLVHLPQTPRVEPVPGKVKPAEAPAAPATPITTPKSSVSKSVPIVAAKPPAAPHDAPPPKSTPAIPTAGTPQPLGKPKIVSPPDDVVEFVPITVLDDEVDLVPVTVVEGATSARASNSGMRLKRAQPLSRVTKVSALPSVHVTIEKSARTLPFSTLNVATVLAITIGIFSVGSLIAFVVMSDPATDEKAVTADTTGAPATGASDQGARPSIPAENVIGPQPTHDDLLLPAITNPIPAVAADGARTAIEPLNPLPDPHTKPNPLRRLIFKAPGATATIRIHGLEQLESGSGVMAAERRIRRSRTQQQWRIGIVPATAGRQSVVAIDRNGTTDPIEIASFFMNQSELWCTMPRFSNTDIQNFQSRLSLCVIELSIHGGLPQFVALTRPYLNKTIPLSDGTTEIRLPQTHAISELYLASGTLISRTPREKRFYFGHAFDRPTTSWDLPAVAREYDLLTASVNVRLAADAIQVSLDLEASTKASNAAKIQQMQAEQRELKSLLRLADDEDNWQFTSNRVSGRGQSSMLRLANLLQLIPPDEIELPARPEQFDSGQEVQDYQSKVQAAVRSYMRRVNAEVLVPAKERVQEIDTVTAHLMREQNQTQTSSVRTAKRELTELNIDIYRIVDSHGTPIRVMLVKAPTRR